MVILKGVVRSGRASNANEGDVPVAGAAIIQPGGTVYTSSNGTFYTSALTLDIVTCTANEYRTVDYSIPDFATTYDPSGVISGSLTRNIDTTSYPGLTMMWDDNKIFMDGVLTGRIIEMRSGVDDGKTGIIANNTQNGILVGGTSGSTPGGYSWELVSSTTEYIATKDGAMVTTESSETIMLGGEVSYNTYTNDVWISQDNGVNWTLQTPSPNSRWVSRKGLGAVYLPKTGNLVVMGGQNSGAESGHFRDVWYSPDKGCSWTPQPKAPWVGRAFHMCVVVDDIVPPAFEYSPYYLPALPDSDYWRGEYSPSGEHLVVSYSESHVGDTRLLRIDDDEYTDLGVLISGTSIPYSNMSWSKDGTYLAVNNGSLYIFKRSGDTLTRLANPVVVPSSSNTGVAWSPDGSHLLVAGNGSGASGAMLYSRSGDTFTNISGNGGIVCKDPYEINYYSNHVVLADWATEFLKVYKRSGNNYTLIANLEHDEGAAWSDAIYSPDGNYLLACAYAYWASNNISIYSISGDNYTFTASAHVDAPLSSINISPDGEIFAVGMESDTGDGVQVFSFSGGVATKITPEPLYINPDYSDNWFNEVVFSPDNTHLVVLSDNYTGHYLGLNAFVRGGGAIDSIVVMGGTNGYKRTDDVWKSQDGGETWSCLASSNVWGDKNRGAAVVVSGNIIITGGGSPQTNEVWRSNDGGSTWACLTSNAEWGFRADHNCVTLSDGTMILYGGDNSG